MHFLHCDYELFTKWSLDPNIQKPMTVVKLNTSVDVIRVIFDYQL